MKKAISAVLTLLLISGCVAPPRQLSKSDAVAEVIESVQTEARQEAPADICPEQQKCPVLQPNSNTGLKIALVSFILLFVVASGLCYYFFKCEKSSTLEAIGATAREKVALQDNASLNNEIQQLKANKNNEGVGVGEKAQLVRANRDLQESVNFLEMQLSTKEQELNYALGELRQTKEKGAQVLQNNKNLNADNEQLVQKNNLLVSENATLKQDILKVNKKNDIHLQQKQELARQNDVWSRNIIDIKAANFQLEQEIKRLKAALAKHN
ncbi:hypothetical protein [Candidatus Endomicrobiellum agilis]|uniref:hypothetical protein n=1 Tax=Candidatus Endomicrobiellum agilis TaxID=3238957 RepID=UPI00358BBBB7|nr:hypothetical protein [Endomicrobium sp.]